MNQSRRQDDNTRGIPAGLKVAVLVCALVVIMTAVYQFHAQPAEALDTPVKATAVPPQAQATNAVSLITPFEGSAMSADGSGSTTSPMAVAQRPGVEQQAIAAMPGMYAEPATNAVGDGDNHPPSF
jgi:hypothetical protein